MEKGVLFSRFRPDSKIKIMAEPEMIEFLQKKEYHVLQIVDLLGSRPINVLRYLVEYQEMPTNVLTL